MVPWKRTGKKSVSVSIRGPSRIHIRGLYSETGNLFEATGTWRGREAYKPTQFHNENIHPERDAVKESFKLSLSLEVIFQDRQIEE